MREDEERLGHGTWCLLNVHKKSSSIIWLYGVDHIQDYEEQGRIP